MHMAVKFKFGHRPCLLVIQEMIFRRVHPLGKILHDSDWTKSPFSASLYPRRSVHAYNYTQRPNVGCREKLFGHLYLEGDEIGWRVDRQFLLCRVWEEVNCFQSQGTDQQHRLFRICFIFWGPRRLKAKMICWTTDKMTALSIISPPAA